MIRLLLGRSYLYPYNIDSAYVQSTYGMDLVSDPLVVGSQRPREGYRSSGFQKMIQPVGKLSSATSPPPLHTVERLLFTLWSWRDSPSPCHLVIPTHETYFFSGASTLNLTSHSFPLPGPHSNAEPSLDPDMRSGISGDGAHNVLTSDACPCSWNASS
jgi:hypothetical protein